jgi:RHS repeat-associated protein
VLTLSWDPLGRLAQVQSNLAGTATYRYDPLDRLDAVVSPTSTASFAYVGLTDAVAAVTTTPSGGSASTRYVEAGADGAELLEYDSVARVPTYVGRDAHGDTAWTYGGTGAPAAWASYDPFGNRSGTALAYAGWQGSYRDAFSGLYYVVARWYDPKSGAFTSQDPVEGDTGDPQSLDPYPYGRGDPVGSTDPDGRAPVGLPHMVPGWRQVNQFHEPIGTKKYPHDWSICVSGALRVVLAFTSRAPEWVWPTGASRPHWPTQLKGYQDKNPGGRVEKPNSGVTGRDTWGQGYMLYLAYGARVPGLGKNPHNGRTGSLYDWGQSNDPGPLSATYAAMSFANWETRGEPTGPGRDVDPPFGYGDYQTKQKYFLPEVKWSIDLGVPVAVGLLWSLYPHFTEGLPSWKISSTHYFHPGDCTYIANDKCPHLHAVAIVGYDDVNLYYVDTCWTATDSRAALGCRTGQANATARIKSTMPNVWQINAGSMWRLMHDNPQGGFYYFGGGYWDSARHAPW